jgi:hypothetical protein
MMNIPCIPELSREIFALPLTFLWKRKDIGKELCTSISSPPVLFKDHRIGSDKGGRETHTSFFSPSMELVHILPGRDSSIPTRHTLLLHKPSAKLTESHHSHPSTSTFTSTSPVSQTPKKDPLLTTHKKGLRGPPPHRLDLYPLLLGHR